MAAMLTPARDEISRTVAARSPRPAKTSPAAARMRRRVSGLRSETGFERGRRMFKQPFEFGTHLNACLNRRKWPRSFRGARRRLLDLSAVRGDAPRRRVHQDHDEEIRVEVVLDGGAPIEDED